jgi:hypothetical protein
MLSKKKILLFYKETFKWCYKSKIKKWDNLNPIVLLETSLFLKSRFVQIILIHLYNQLAPKFFNCFTRSEIVLLRRSTSA